jgi:hypothetical protein
VPSYGPFENEMVISELKFQKKTMIIFDPIKIFFIDILIVLLGNVNTGDGCHVSNHRGSPQPPSPKLVG